ncbi:MAG: hypothetical protein ACM31C_05860 [Acidobacteriota bacterium]
MYGRTKGAEESTRWLERCDLEQDVGPWFVEIQIVADDDDDAPSTLDLNIYPIEWDITFRRRGQMSSIKVTGAAHVNGCDDFALLDRVTSLDRFGTLLAAIELQHGLRFGRSSAAVRSNLAGAQRIVRAWLATA